MKKFAPLTLLTSVFASAIIVMAPATTLAAGTASFSLSPASGSQTVNTTFSVTVNETSTDAVNTVTAKVVFDSAHLQLVGVSESGSAFAQGFASTTGNTVSITRYVAPGSAGLTGARKVASVSFKATATGSATLSFASDSQIASNGANVWNGSTTGGTFTIAAASTSTPPTTPPATTPKTSTKKSTTKKTSKPAVLSEDKTAPKTETKTPATTAKKDDTKQVDSKKNSHTTQKVLLGLGIFALAAAAAQALQRRKLDPTATKKAAPVVAPAGAAKGKSAKKKTNKRSSKR